ncbi:MAG: DNA polymerase III subunit delta' [Syntrophus sp. (in: bacteria)]|nr:DNA polymerase III subunit delta' [Syntrophus sp. (in: bacteria)]
MGFNNIVGHERQKEFLLSLFNNERMPHAFLFSGQEGIGKKKLAIEYIKHILCEKGIGCDGCRPCQKIDHRNHPDLLIVEGEESIGIAQSRMISKEVSEHPYEGKKRAILIDRADTMTREATNALLKTLEEPPPANVFFLITSSERDIPLTVRSRCARVAFSPLPQADVEEYFMKVSRMEKEKAHLIARISYGSIGGGLFWAEPDNFILRRKLGEIIIGKKRGFLAVTLIAEKIAKMDKGVSFYLSFLQSLFRDLYVAAHERETSMIINRDIKDLIEREGMDLKRIDSSLKKIQETIFNMRYNVNRWLLLENLMLHIMR